MFHQRHRAGARNDTPAPEWSRQKMLALLVGAGITVLALVVGLVLAVVYAVHPVRHPEAAADTTRTSANGTSAGGSGAAGSGGSRTGTDPRDVLADRAMPAVNSDASHPGPVSAADPATTIVVPAATAPGPAHVPTGFPHTPQGAIGQLAAIDEVALESGSLAGARSVITSWAMPGGPTASSWSLIRALITLFDETGVSSGGFSQLALVLTPVMGEIKGSIGPDFVVPCIDFELDITLQQTARGADADCQRMVWNPDPTAPGGAGGRWMIGPGSEPAYPPSVWPDTDTAIAVGYHDLRQEPRS
jgi:hypothetical protein